jgi:nicotinamide riboside transporter PnuC
MEHILPWSLAVLSIIGAILNIRKKRSGFAVYTVANMGWIIVDIYYGIYAQALLFAVFTVLSSWGWIEWGRKPWGKR